MDTKSKNMRVGAFFAFCNVFVGAFIIVLGQPLFEIFSPLTLAFLENIAALCIMLFTYGFLPEYKKLCHMSGKKILGVVLFALCSSVIAPLLFYFGWSLSTPNNVFLLGQAEMLFMVLLAAIFLREKITRKQISGIILMFLGLYFIASRGFAEAFSFQKGDTFILLSGVFWAVGAIIHKKMSSHMPMELVLILRFLLGTTILAGIFFATGEEGNFLKESIQPIHLWYFLAYVLCMMILRKYFYLKSIQKAPLYVFSAVALTSPVLGLICNYLFLKEIPEIFHYVGGGLILLGFGVLQFHFHLHKKFSIPHFIHTRNFLSLFRKRREIEEQETILSSSLQKEYIPVPADI